MGEARATTDQLDYPGDGLHYRDGRPFTGVLEFRRPDGGLEGEEVYRDGLLSGRRRAWWPTGGLQEEAECAWGGYHGTVRKWHESGRLASEAVYEFGVRVRGAEWDENGRLADEFTLGPTDPAYSILEAARRAAR